MRPITSRDWIDGVLSALILGVLLAVAAWIGFEMWWEHYGM